MTKRYYSSSVCLYTLLFCMLNNQGQAFNFRKSTNFNWKGENSNLKALVFIF